MINFVTDLSKNNGIALKCYRTSISFSLFNELLFLILYDYVRLEGEFLLFLWLFDARKKKTEISMTQPQFVKFSYKIFTDQNKMSLIEIFYGSPFSKLTIMLILVCAHFVRFRFMRANHEIVSNVSRNIDNIIKFCMAK